MSYVGCVAQTEFSAAAAANPIVATCSMKSTDSSRWWFPTASTPASFGTTAPSGTQQTCCVPETQASATTTAMSVGPSIPLLNCDYTANGACAVLAFRGTPPTSDADVITFKNALTLSLATAALGGIQGATAAQVQSWLTAHSPVINTGYGIGANTTYMVHLQIAAPPANYNVSAVGVMNSISANSAAITSGGAPANQLLIPPIAFVSYGNGGAMTSTGMTGSMASGTGATGAMASTGSHPTNGATSSDASTFVVLAAIVAVVVSQL